MGRWDRYAIRAELGRRGLTLTAVAINAGLDPSACRAALLRPYAAAEKAIARAIEEQPETLWPDRYQASASSNASRRRLASQKLRPRLTKRAV